MNKEFLCLDDEKTRMITLSFPELADIILALCMEDVSPNMSVSNLIKFLSDAQGSKIKLDTEGTMNNLNTIELTDNEVKLLAVLVREGIDVMREEFLKEKSYMFWFTYNELKVITERIESIDNHVREMS